jgi:hypothetical protein
MHLGMWRFAVCRRPNRGIIDVICRMDFVQEPESTHA